MISLQRERLEIKDIKQNLTNYSKETIKRVNIMENKKLFDSLTEKRLEKLW